MQKQNDGKTLDTKAGKERGTDSDSIKSRLETFYPNLHASSPREVKVAKQRKMWRYLAPPSPVVSKDLDGNNNNNNNEEEQPKIKYELPQDYQGTKSCTCLRPASAFECGVCHHFIQGRLSEICEKHPLEVFLMDLTQCPYCQAPLGMIKESALSWEEIRKIEEADLPSDSDI